MKKRSLKTALLAPLSGAAHEDRNNVQHWHSGGNAPPAEDNSYALVYNNGFCWQQFCLTSHHTPTH